MKTMISDQSQTKQDRMDADIEIEGLKVELNAAMQTVGELRASLNLANDRITAHADTTSETLSRLISAKEAISALQRQNKQLLGALQARVH